MISSSRQLKDKVRNISDGNSNKATTLIRNFMMERFLERVSISSYRDNFILKGGMLVASIVGVDMRATMDIDTTVKALQSCGYETIASGDSYNDLGMIKASKAGFLFRSTEQIIKDYPQFPAFTEYNDLLNAIKSVIK